MLLLCGPEQAWKWDFVKPKGFKFSKGFEDNGTRFMIKGRPLFIEGEGMSRGDRSQDHTIATAAVVWDCSIVLSKFLEQNAGSGSEYDVSGKRAIELGSGRGLVGLAATILGAELTLTDVDSVTSDLEGIISHEKITGRKTLFRCHIGCGYCVGNGFDKTSC
ncbi:hypothetical protein HDU97_010393 [Phlyctochytrium planicorne]|nr:hypothetical protein HDU97_010393 [Phlyctochytrium planicorne]